MRVGVGGLGAAGLPVVLRLGDGLPGLVLTAIASRDRDKAHRMLGGIDVPIVSPGELGEMCDVVVECLPPAVFRTIAEPAIDRGRILMPLSVGQLLDSWDLVDRAAQSGGRIIVPTGALLGLDAVRAAAEGTIRSVTMVTRKPPNGLAGAPYLQERAIELSGLTEPLKVFEGTAREAARGFPANLNVAVALSLAGIGPDRTRLEIWADPTVQRNMHRIEVDADSARFSMAIENVPSYENPRTGRITALSTLAALRGLVSNLKIGS
ncbi:MAG: aspartate dehydrogenase [Pseudomonadota bacterium]|nr:aspartate dehydrogenase [Pseudomonadota bacterium]